MIQMLQLILSHVQVRSVSQTQWLKARLGSLLVSCQQETNQNTEYQAELSIMNVNDCATTLKIPLGTPACQSTAPVVGILC